MITECEDLVTQITSIEGFSASGASFKEMWAQAPQREATGRGAKLVDVPASSADGARKLMGAIRLRLQSWKRHEFAYGFLGYCF